MKKNKRSVITVLILVLFGILSFVVGSGNLLKTQLLREPEALDELKLIRQETDPIRFDIYYQGIKEKNPRAINIRIIKAFLDENGKFSNKTHIIQSVILKTGTQEITETENSQTLKIRNITKQASSKLGTIISNIPRSKYISMEYDINLNGIQRSIIDNPLPIDFPQNFKRYQNPTGEPLYIAIPGFHTILAPLERVYLRYPKIQLGAVLLANTLTSFENLENLNRKTIIRQSITRESPKLIVDQHQIIIPKIPEQDLNTLIIRMKNESSDWRYENTLLSARKNIALPVKISDLLDFYTEIEYSFAYISNAFPTVNLEFPYNSLMPRDEFPLFYRTKYESLIPELTKEKNGLAINLKISTVEKANSIYIGFLSRSEINSIPEAIHYLEQKIPVAIIDDGSEKFSTIGKITGETPSFHLLGKNDQVWSQKIEKTDLRFISNDFEAILLKKKEGNNDLEIIRKDKGEKLLCFIKSDEGSFSLPVERKNITFSTECLRSARISGINRGEIFPVVYKKSTNTLEALKNFKYDDRLGKKTPKILSYDPNSKIIILNTGFDDKTIKSIVSPTPNFDSFALVNMENTGKSHFSLPSFPGCNESCYFKVLSIIKEDETATLAYASKTMIFSENPDPLLQVCFTNQSYIKELYDPQKLTLEIYRKDKTTISMKYRRDAGCYEMETKLTSKPVEEDQANIDKISSLKDMEYKSKELPDGIIMIQTNGYSNSYITIPTQRFYINLDNRSEQQILMTELVFEHIRLRENQQADTNKSLSKSYQISQWGSMGTYFTENNGTLLIQKLGEQPDFMQRFSAKATINETLLFPSEKNTLAIPHTIRLIPAEEVLLSGYSSKNNTININLEIPENSQAKIFLDKIIRPNIQKQIMIKDGIKYNTENGLITLINPIGTISIPISLSIDKSTNTDIYEKNPEKTIIPTGINTAYIKGTILIKIDQPKNIPASNIREPIKLKQAEENIKYSEKISLFGIENARAFEILDNKFFSTECQKSFSFDPSERNITGEVAESSKLQGCYFQILIRYITRNEFSDMEITTTMTYLFPIGENLFNTKKNVNIISIALDTESEEINELINLKTEVEDLVETTSSFENKNNTSSVISKIGEIQIIFNEKDQQFIVSGSANDLSQEKSKYLRAIEKETGRLVLFELRLVPVHTKEIIIPISKSFPNMINVKEILSDEGYSKEETKNLTIETGSLSSSVDVSDTGIVTIYGSDELQDQVFYVLIDKPDSTPEELIDFDKRIRKEEKDSSNNSNTLMIKFRLQIKEPELVTMDSLHVGTDKMIVIDMKQFAPFGETLIANQLPEFLTREGDQLKGKTPKEAQELNILIQDYTNVRNIIVPILIGEPEKQTPVKQAEDNKKVIKEIKPEKTKEEAIESSFQKANKKAADNSNNCFPDIGDQPIEYRESICLAKKYRIISGIKNQFFPDSAINRAEVSKILVTGPLVLLNLLTEEESKSLNNSFSEQGFLDVPSVSWFFGYVETVRAVGIFSGYPDGTFQPGSNMNKAEAAKVIVNTLMTLEPSSFSPDESISANTFQGDQWYAPYVRILKKNGGDFPDTSNTDALGTPITRAEFIYNLLILLDSKADQILSGL